MRLTISHVHSLRSTSISMMGRMSLYFGRVSFRNGHEPFPFPRCWGMLMSPHGRKTSTCFRYHGRGPVLEMFVLKAREAPRGVPIFGVEHSCEFVEGGRDRD